MRSEHSFVRTKYLFPVLVGGTVSLNAFFIIYKGAKGLDLDETPLNVACAWAFGIGGVSGLAIIPFLPAISQKAENAINNNKVEIENMAEPEQNPEQDPEDNPDNGVENEQTGVCNKLVKYVNDSIKFDIDTIIEEDEVVAKIHGDAEVFEPKTEEFFKSIQVFTAICDSFSHGANDVANAIGPFMAIYIISKNGTVTKDNDFGSDAYWFLALGGIGISFGLFIYGYKILHAIGTKLCKLTPSRGSAIELASAIVIITGSRLEIPLSTTHCQVGATMGVAALEDPYTCKGINMKIIFKCIAGWVITLVVVGSTTALITAQGAYTPEVGQNC